MDWYILPLMMPERLSPILSRLQDSASLQVVQQSRISSRGQRRASISNRREESSRQLSMAPPARMISLPNLGRKVLIFSSVRIMMVESMESLSLTTIPIQFSMAHDLAESSRQMPLNVGSTVTVRSLKSQCLISPMYRTGHNRQVRHNQEVQHLQTVLQTIKIIKQVNRHLLTQPTLTNHRFPDWICSSSVPASMPNRRL